MTKIIYEIKQNPAVSHMGLQITSHILEALIFSLILLTSIPNKYNTTVFYET